MTEYIQVFVTIDEKDIAEKIASEVLEKRLAACVQVIGPITSRYWWEEKIETSEEWLCLMKSRKALYQGLEKTVKSIHPYDVAEILAVPVAMGSQEYLAWLDKAVGSR
ncbi:MAG: divalent-cation tolerance protein CutA [Desulfobacteraceae bacterium]|jgi:periplasmic divalent cation tolerance protein